MIERISNKLATCIAFNLNMDEDNREVLAYGAFSILQTLWSIFLVIIFGLLFGVVLEALIISAVGAFLRKYSGGVHATAPNRCAIIGVIMSVGLALLVMNLIINLNVILTSMFILFCYIVTYYCICKYCPRDTPNKPIVKPEKRIKLKKSAKRLVHLFGVLTVMSYILFLNGYSYFTLSLGIAISAGLLIHLYH